MHSINQSINQSIYFQDMHISFTIFNMNLVLPTISTKSVGQMYDAKTACFCELRFFGLFCRFSLSISIYEYRARIVGGLQVVGSVRQPLHTSTCEGRGRNLLPHIHTTRSPPPLPSPVNGDGAVIRIGTFHPLSQASR